ncbi:MAG TPA: hypothetical protein VFI42_12950 [Thermomicrobiaceae bacterium]|nr:hypothetical protein [Thermomicrobiaceae bacterium]
MGALPNLGVFNRRNLIRFIHKVTTGASGAIASQDAPSDSGVTAVKTATKTGRYTLTLPSKFRKYDGGFVCVCGPDDAVYGAKSKGLPYIMRDNDIDGGAADGTIELQFLNPSTDATNYIDAELPDNTMFYVHIFVEQ